MMDPNLNRQISLSFSPTQMPDLAAKRAGLPEGEPDGRRVSF